MKTYTDAEIEKFFEITKEFEHLTLAKAIVAQLRQQRDEARQKLKRAEKWMEENS